jgi:NADH-quinone oxidoreductase subunit J
MQDILFYLFALLTLLCGALVVANPFSRNPVTSAMFLVLTIVSMAGLFVLLHAFFLAQVQIIVYAGAVIVLFLFVIMLLDLKEEQRRRFNRFGIVTGVISVGAIGAIMVRALWSQGSRAFPASALTGKVLGIAWKEDVKRNGLILFNDYLLPFEILSVLLLVAMVGVILLSKKDLK